MVWWCSWRVHWSSRVSSLAEWESAGREEMIVKGCVSDCKSTVLVWDESYIIPEVYITVRHMYSTFYICKCVQKYIRTCVPNCITDV